MSEFDKILKNKILLDNFKLASFDMREFEFTPNNNDWRFDLTFNFYAKDGDIDNIFVGYHTIRIMIKDEQEDIHLMHKAIELVLHHFNWTIKAPEKY